MGQKVGSRVEMVHPARPGLRQRRATAGGIKGTDTLVFVVDIVNTFNAKSSAKGKEVAQNDADLPKVGTNTDGKAPSIDVPKADAADEARGELRPRGRRRRGQGGQQRPGAVQGRALGHRQGVRLDLQQRPAGVVLAAAGRQGLGAGPDRQEGRQPRADRHSAGLGYGNNPPSGSGIKKDSTLVFSVDILAKM